MYSVNVNYKRKRNTLDDVDVDRRRARRELGVQKRKEP